MVSRQLAGETQPENLAFTQVGPGGIIHVSVRCIGGTREMHLSCLLIHNNGFTAREIRLLLNFANEEIIYTKGHLASSAFVMLGILIWRGFLRIGFR